MLLRKFQTNLLLSGVGCFIAGFSLCFLPFVQPYVSSENIAMSVIPAIILWTGLIVETIFFGFANMNCKAIEKKLILKGSKSFKGMKPGIIVFFSCKEAVVTDILFIISSIAVVWAVVANVTNDWLFVSFMEVFFFSFNLHCFFNGKNYKYLKEIQKYNKRKQGAKEDE